MNWLSSQVLNKTWKEWMELFEAVASNSSKKMLFQNQTCVSGYALSRCAKTVSVDGADEILH